MLFSEFAQYLQKLEAISSRLEMTSQLAELFQRLSIEEVEPASYLLQGQLLPPYESLEFQVAVKTVLKALARLPIPDTQANSEDSLFQGDLFSENTHGHREQEVEKLYKQLGDLGLSAEHIKSAGAISDPSQPLTIIEVYQALSAIAQDSGEGSQERKLNKVVELLTVVDALSAKFITRIIVGKLRLGFSTMTLIDALSWAMTGGKTERAALEEAYQKKADIGKLAAVYLQEKDAELRQQRLQEYTVEVGVPIVPALCQRLNSAQEMVDKMGEVFVEPKYDGLRVQIHIDKNSQSGNQVFLRTYTRNLEENSHMFPELLSVVDELTCQSCILDGEAIGFDRDNDKLLAFQQTITRKRKHDVSEVAQSVPLRFYLFDVLSIDGRSLIDQPLHVRKAELTKLFEENEVFKLSPYVQTNDPEEIRNLHLEYLGEGLEGVVVKQTKSVYQSGRKGWSWVKMKEAEGTRGKLTDTVDCVVMGYYLGRGKRNEFGIGALLVGVLGEGGAVKTLAKIGTGLSDEQLVDMKRRCDEVAVSTPPAAYDVHKNLAPDVYCQPQVVIEVAADEITTSPLHTAGVALRFPRLVKIREDKGWEDATTLEELSQIEMSK